jgi:hypothetical protein
MGSQKKKENRIRLRLTELISRFRSVSKWMNRQHQQDRVIHELFENQRYIQDWSGEMDFHRKKGRSCMTKWNVLFQFFLIIIRKLYILNFD